VSYESGGVRRVAAGLSRAWLDMFKPTV